MIKTLHAMGSNKHGGAELFACRLATALQKKMCNQAMLLRNNSPYLNQLSSELPCFSIPFKGNIDFSSKKKLKQVISDVSPDIVLSYMNRATQLVSQLHRSKKYIHVARLGGYYNLKYYKNCEQFIVNTKDLADYLIKEGVPHQRIHHIYNFSSETPGTKNTNLSSKKSLVAIGRLHKNKAFDTLIYAMQYCHDMTLWIAGEGPEKKYLTNLIIKLKLNDRVKLLGWVDQPQNLIASCDLFICPSRHEPLGNVILETWAQKTPILCTQSQGGKELIEHGHTGWLVPIDQPKKMSAAINQLLSNEHLLDSLATEGWKYYHQNFSESVITKKYAALFEQLTTGIS